MTFGDLRIDNPWWILLLALLPLVALKYAYRLEYRPARHRSIGLFLLCHRG